MDLLVYVFFLIFFYVCDFFLLAIQDSLCTYLIPVSINVTGGMMGVRNAFIWAPPSVSASCHRGRHAIVVILEVVHVVLQLLLRVGV